MVQNRVRIVDVADALGLSSATVSNVIHGQTEKISDETVKERKRFLQGMGIQIPNDIQIIGFDDNMTSRESNPSLTTIHQEASLRAKTAIECLEAMRDGVDCESEIVLPVTLIKRESTGVL